MKNKSENQLPDKKREDDFDRQYDHPAVVRIGKEKLEIYDTKPEQPKTEVPVVFAPGWMPSPKMSKDVVRAIFDKGRRTLSFYAPHGVETDVIKSKEAARDVAYAELRKVEALLKTLDEKGIEKTDAAGHSEGGMYLAYAALFFPEKFRNIVLVDPVGIVGEDNMVRLGLGALEDIRTQGKKQKKGLEAGEKKLEPDWKYVLDFLKTGPGLMFREVHAMANADITWILAELKKKGIGISIIHGGDDKYFPMERVQQMVKTNQIDGFYSVKGGHMEIITRAGRYAGLVEQAFTDLENKREGKSAYAASAGK